MTLFIWLDENGEWRVTHLPPEGCTFLRVIFALIKGDDGPMFFNDSLEEVQVRVQ